MWFSKHAATAEDLVAIGLAVRRGLSLIVGDTHGLAASEAPLFDEFKHGIVVTERRWYEQWRHTHPYSYWRMYESREEYSRQEFIATRGAPANPNFLPRNESQAKRDAANAKRH